MWRGWARGSYTRLSHWRWRMCREWSLSHFIVQMWVTLSYKCAEWCPPMMSSQWWWDELSVTVCTWPYVWTLPVASYSCGYFILCLCTLLVCCRHYIIVYPVYGSIPMPLWHYMWVSGNCWYFLVGWITLDGLTGSALQACIGLKCWYHSHKERKGDTLYSRHLGGQSTLSSFQW